MDLISNQVRVLQEMKSKCIEICGFYGDIDTAIAALQICNTLGLDNTARMISTLKRNGIENDETLSEFISKMSIMEEKDVITNMDDAQICPTCNSILDKVTRYCSICGQRLKEKHVI